MIGLQLLFWLSGVLLVLAYPGYAMLLRVLTLGLGRGRSLGGDQTRSVSVVLVAKNEAERIRERITNLLEGAPSGLREIIIVCDGCTDDTADRARSLREARVRVMEFTEGRGKPAGVNAGVAASSGEVVVLCDARQRFAKDTIARLVSWFDDPETGAVSGALEIERSAGGAGKGVDAYWRLEKAIRQAESDLDSSVGCTGAVYAIRRELFEPLPEDTILDDVVVPMQIAEKGYRVRFDAEALAFDPQTLDGSKETRRKVRTLAGNFQMMEMYAHWMLPWGHRLWLKLILHKYLRLLGPVLLALTLCASSLLMSIPFYWLMTTLQLCLYAAAVVGMTCPGIKTKLLSLPAGFMFLQICVVRGWIYWLNSDSKRGWK